MDNNTSKKLHQNTNRVVAISTLAKIRNVVDRLDEQDHNDKKHLLIILIITISLAIATAYVFIYSNPRYQSIQTNNSNTINLLTFVS